MTVIKYKKGISLYYQIKEYLEEQIESGIWKPGTQIPTEINLSKLFGVSRMTVRRAISELVQNGKLITKQGSGTFVADKKLEGNFVKFYYPKEFGEFHKLLNFTHINCPLSIAQKLNIKEGEPITQIYRLRFFNDTPVILEKSYLQKKLFPYLRNEDLSLKLHDLIKEKYKIDLINIKTSIEPVVLSEYEAEILQVKHGSPALLLTRIKYTYNKKPIIFSKNLIRGDKCRLLIDY